VFAALAASGPGQPAVDPTTGEIIGASDPKSTSVRPDTGGVSVAGSRAPS
jgi:hypothetical protein